MAARSARQLWNRMGERCALRWPRVAITGTAEAFSGGTIVDSQPILAHLDDRDSDQDNSAEPGRDRRPVGVPRTRSVMTPTKPSAAPNSIVCYSTRARRVGSLEPASKTNTTGTPITRTRITTALVSVPWWLQVRQVDTRGAGPSVNCRKLLALEWFVSDEPRCRRRRMHKSWPAPGRAGRAGRT
jgi:hypothetical protein